MFWHGFSPPDPTLVQLCGNMCTWDWWESTGVVGERENGKHGYGFSAGFPILCFLFGDYY